MESEAAAALAAAVVEAAAAATVETAALVGEAAAAAAAEEEEGEAAAAAAKGKRTALPGLSGTPSPGSPLISPHPPALYLEETADSRGPCGAPASSSHSSSPPPPSFPSGEVEREAPQVLLSGRGWGASGRAWALGSKCVGGGGDSLESGAGRAPGGGGCQGVGEGPCLHRCPPVRPFGVCEMGGGGRRTLLGGSRAPNQDDFGARDSGGGSGGEIVVYLSNIGFLQPFFKWGASPSGKVWPLDFNGQIILAFCPISLKS